MLLHTLKSCPGQMLFIFFYSFDGTKLHETSHMALATLLVQKLANC